jgi:hypothetical protein
VLSEKQIDESARRIALFIAGVLADGGIILVNNPDGTVDRIRFPNLEGGDDRSIHVERWRMASNLARQDVPV